MTSKLPSKDQSTRPSLAHQGSPRPASTIDAKKTGSAVRASETFAKRRSGLYAGGLFVIVCAGAILGAQLKTRRQAQARLASEGQDIFREDAASNTRGVGYSLSTEASLGDAADTASAKVSQSPMIDRTSERGPKDSQDGGRGTSYDQRQILLLQDRRAELLRKKLELEQKIERVKEKRILEEQREGRRSTRLDGDR